MRRLLVPMLGAVILLAANQRGVPPRGSAKDYPSHNSADGITIAAVVPAGRVRNQLGREMLKARYTVVEVAVYPGPGKTVDLSRDDFSMTIGSNPEVTRAEPSAVVAASIEADLGINRPQIPGRVQVYGEETIGVSSGGRDPVTGRRYPGGVYSETRVGVGVGDPRVGDPPLADPRYPPRDPRNQVPLGGTAPQRNQRSLGDKLEEKALPEGRTMKAVAGYLYFPENSPRLANSSEPYHITYSGPMGQIHLTVPAK
jgi:hypothetical protein